MSQQRNPTVIAAWITGSLGCAGVILLVIGSIIAALIQKNAAKSPPVTVLAPTSPLPLTADMPTVPATTLRVINNTLEDICNVFMVPTGSETWGQDWLNVGESILPNKGRIFTLKPGMYHLLVENCDQETIAESLDNHIEGDMHWVVQKVSSDSSDTVLKVINNSSDSICNFYISPSGTDDWGEDWLGDDQTIPAGQTLTFSLKTGMYDLLAENCTGDSLAESQDSHLQGNMEWTIK